MLFGIDVCHGDQEQDGQSAGLEECHGGWGYIRYII